MCREAACQGCDALAHSLEPASFARRITHTAAVIDDLQLQTVRLENGSHHRPRLAAGMPGDVGQRLLHDPIRRGRDDLWDLIIALGKD